MNIFAGKRDQQLTIFFLFLIVYYGKVRYSTGDFLF